MLKYKSENLEKRRERESRILAQDLFNSYACTYDKNALEEAEDTLRDAFDILRSYAVSKPHIELWVDGSYNPKTKTAGIGIIVARSDMPDIAFGKAVKAKDSLTAEIYALSIGLSYVLDTFPVSDCIVVRYDCVNSAICATNIDPLAAFGSPYTNFRSALKRIRRKRIDVLFRHTDAHADDKRNNDCDLIAKYYSKIKLQGPQLKRVKQLLKKNK